MSMLEGMHVYSAILHLSLVSAYLSSSHNLRQNKNYQINKKKKKQIEPGFPIFLPYFVSLPSDISK